MEEDTIVSRNYKTLQPLQRISSEQEDTNDIRINIVYLTINHNICMITSINLYQQRLSKKILKFVE